MRKILIVVDMQKDFVDGALGTKEAVAIVDAVVDVIQGFDGEVVYTKDTHFDNYMETQEGKKLPVPHCIKDSEGWQLAGKVQAVLKENSKVFEKETFGSKELAQYLEQENEKEAIEEITLIGLCTDICVISNAMLIKAFLPEARIQVVERACAGVTAESHHNALEAMKVCQIEVC
ncbi:MAG: cysteine hydrolase [Lachnospira sp.]|nr:cysteine hydrolase [Lachnospira sp.]